MASRGLLSNNNNMNLHISGIETIIWIACLYQTTEWHSNGLSSSSIIFVNFLNSKALINPCHGIPRILSSSRSEYHAFEKTWRTMLLGSYSSDVASRPIERPASPPPWLLTSSQDLGILASNTSDLKYITPHVIAWMILPHIQSRIILSYTSH